jgi:hypothetical protein
LSFFFFDLNLGLTPQAMCMSPLRGFPLTRRLGLTTIDERRADSDFDSDSDRDRDSDREIETDRENFQKKKQARERACEGGDCPVRPTSL